MMELTPLKHAFARRWIVMGALSSLMVAGLGSCGGGTATSVPDAVAPAANPVALRATTDTGLVQYFRTALGPTSGANNPLSMSKDLALATNAGSASSTPVAAPMAPGAAVSSGTTLQEAGVDEADWIKSDGSQVFSLDPTNVSGSKNGGLRRLKLNADKPQLTQIDSVSAPLSSDMRATGMYLDSERKQVIVLGEGVRTWSSYDAWFAPNVWGSGETEFSLVSTASDTPMQKLRTVRISAHMLGSRRIGSTLYLVLRSYPQLPGLDPAWPSTKLASNQAIVDAAQPAQLLPTISVDGGPAQALVQASACFVQDANVNKSADVITVVGVDLAGTSHRHGARCFTGGTEAFYMSEKNLYLSTTRTAYSYSGITPVYGTEPSTDIHQFALNGLEMVYQGSGTVPGHLGWEQNRKSYRMGEHQGTLRVLTQTGNTWNGWIGLPMPAVTGGISATPVNPTLPTTPTVPTTPTATTSPAKLSLLQVRDGNLVTVGELPNATRPAPLGKVGEQIYATRFLGNRGYLVTYRLTDPLYVLDLSDPKDPKVSGELQVEGYSDYLFPLSETLLLGVGKDAYVDGTTGDGRAAWYQGVKLSLIDVSDPAQPIEAARSTIGKRGTDAAVLRDPHAIAIQTSASSVRISLPVSLYDTPPFDARGLPSDYYRFTRVELQKFEIDLPKKAFNARAALASITPGQSDISNHRSLLWNNQVHYFHDGVWQSENWQ
ncbi:MAG: beta-propeller domain-containing protein [Rhodoferax sp.]|nr:beta-propeller domain-containing protein [Rhodoferax sp.]